MNAKIINRNTFIITLWTFLYFLWFRWFMLSNWDFEIFKAENWQFIFHQWWYGGWIIQGSYYWIFIISLLLCIPVWIMSTCFFLSLNYSGMREKIFWDSIYKKKTKKIQANDRRIRVKKKKSYTEIRPRALAGTPQSVASVQQHSPDMLDESPSASAGSKDLLMQENFSAGKGAASFSHREIADNYEGDSPFATNESEYGLPQNAFDANEMPEALNENLPQIMTTAGAEIIEKPVLGDQGLDYLAIANGQAFLILTDSQKGDWLADEERFNDEDPLWFSETSHRVSPITTLKKFDATLQKEMSAAGIKADTHIILVKTDGNIINAEDMQDIWKQMNVLVARSATGMPEELPSFTDTFPAHLDAADKAQVDQIKTLVKG